MADPRCPILLMQEHDFVCDGAGSPNSADVHIIPMLVGFVANFPRRPKRAIPWQAHNSPSSAQGLNALSLKTRKTAPKSVGPGGYGEFEHSVSSQDNIALLSGLSKVIVSPCFSTRLDHFSVPLNQVFILPESTDSERSDVFVRRQI